mgnify:CR=1 FL=1
MCVFVYLYVYVQLVKASRDKTNSFNLKYYWYNTFIFAEKIAFILTD